MNTGKLGSTLPIKRLIKSAFKPSQQESYLLQESDSRFSTSTGVPATSSHLTHSFMTPKTSQISAYSTDRKFFSTPNDADEEAYQGRGHYDIIYRNNSPITVMLHWNPEAVRNTTNIEQPGDTYLFMFPYSAYTEAPFRYSDNQESQADTQHSDSRSHHFHYDSTHNTTEYEQCSMAHPFSSPVPMATTQSYQSSASSDARHEYFSLPHQTSTAPNSPPPFPSTSIQPATLPNEPQIRLSTNMFRHGQGQVALPLDPRHVGRYAIDDLECTSQDTDKLCIAMPSHQIIFTIQTSSQKCGVRRTTTESDV